jgi:1-aminocyclopropane-1-carboxylate deaminase
MQGSIDLIRRGDIAPGSRVLYTHLGGVPAINGYSFLFRDG